MENYKDLIKEAFSEILTNPVFSEEKIAKYFSTGYQQHVDGKVLNYDQFIDHIKILKQKTATIEFEYKTIVQENEIVFTNHLVNVTKPDGSKGIAHLIAEFHLRDHKIVYCSELSRLVSGDEEDRDMGSVH